VRAFFREDHDCVNKLQCRNHGGTLAFRHERTPRPFELSAGRIGVEADDEQVAESPGTLKVTHVAEMQEVEAAIGRDDALVATMSACGPALGL
jgi:hypothetical protein